MSLHRLFLRALTTAAAFIAVTGAASAQQAPILYAAVGGGEGAMSQPISLAGGGENSYGYGGSEHRRDGAVIDIRRPPAERPHPAEAELAGPPEPAPAQPQPEAPAAPSERPAWLEEERVGSPYRANGRWYVPTPEPGYAQTGTASWYGPQFHGRRTASGEVFDQDALTAAHPTLPLNSLVQVTNLENGREVMVRVTDRGPFARERLIDLSRAAARVLDFERAGHARVHVRYLGPAPRRVDAAAAAEAPAPAPAETGEEGPFPPPEAPEGPASLRPPPAPIEATSSVSSAGYFVQVGAFSDVANAQRVREAVASAGPVSIDVRRTASGGELFRVRVGPLLSEGDAETARARLTALGYGDSIVATR